MRSPPFFIGSYPELAKGKFYQRGTDNKGQPLFWWRTARSNLPRRLRSSVAHVLVTECRYRWRTELNDPDARDLSACVDAVLYR